MMEMVPVVVVGLNMEMGGRRNYGLTSETLKLRLMMVEMVGWRLRRRGQEAGSGLHHSVIVVLRLVKVVDLRQPLRSRVQMPW